MTQIDLFKKIWGEREHVSFLTQKPLCFFGVIHFAHVLPKGKWPLMKYDDRNIVLLTGEEHRLYDFGTERERERYAEKYKCDWNKLFDYKEQLKAEYRKLK
jgi:hypothetical protein